jgi:hypothetical protein
MTNPRRGDGEPVYAVGWALSDYWASRVWANPPFGGTLVPPEPQWEVIPSLQGLARPAVLAFADVCEFEQKQPQARSVSLVTARYRLTDGACLNCVIRGAGGISYAYASHRPRPKDLPAAIEFRLRARDVVGTQPAV